MHEILDFPPYAEFISASSSSLCCRRDDLTSSKPSFQCLSQSIRSSAPPSPPTTPPGHVQSSTFVATASQFLPSRQGFLTHLDQSLQRQPRDIRLTRHAAVNPILRSCEHRRAQKRNSFLNRIEEHRNERRWDARGDQILQHDYVAQKRAWEEHLAQAAPSLDPDHEIALLEQEQSRVSSTLVIQSIQDSRNPEQMGRGRICLSHVAQGEQSQQQFEQDDEIEFLLATEMRELDALIELHETHPQDDNKYQNMQIASPLTHSPCYGDPVASSPTYGSDDEEFDQLLLALEDSSEIMDLSAG